MNSNNLNGKKILITAGPTMEAIDPQRYISNHCSGKLGYALAEEFLQQGAEVFLVSGPVCINIAQHQNLEIVHVQSASEMYMTCCRFFEKVDVALFTAEVSDFRPARVADRRIGKHELEFTIRMVRNVDIAAEFGKVKSAGQLSVGFVVEKEDEFAHAMKKLHRKNFDMVVLDTSRKQNQSDSHTISVFKNDLSRTDFPQKTLNQAAADIVFEVGAALTHAAIAELEERVQAYEMMYS
jgi:phosphopantothenoylcysteine decarboxylase/phosphopantothenate--cysteine ligase